MTSNVKVSVIVPVYNVEKYLKDCLNSVINQTLEDIEIICVNDGSTDNSLAILEDYAKKDSRIKIINQKNKGLSGARNTGMKHVQGEYVLFLDSADWLNEDALSKLYWSHLDDNLDMLFFQTVDYYEEDGRYELNQFGGMTAIDDSFEGKIFNYKDVASIIFKIPHSAFNKLYSTSFLQRINASFPEGINYEDLAFFYDVFLKAERVSILKKELLFYRIRENSISTSGGEKSFDIFKSLKLVNNSLKNTTIIVNKYLQDYLMFIIVNLKFVFVRLKDEYKNDYFKLMLENYEYFGLDKVDNDFSGWSYEDRIFYQSIKKAKDGYEFDLIYNKDCQTFLVNHYKGLVEKLENENQRLVEEINQLKNNNSSVKNKFKNIFRS